MRTDFKGKTAVITGGTKGLGLALARILAAEGTDLILGYRSDEESAERARKELDTAVRCRTVRVDLCEAGAADRLFDEVERILEGRPLDFYVHNAAATAFKSLVELEEHHIDKTFALTVRSFIRGMRRCVALMPEGGAVVTVSGMDTLKAVPKHGLLGAAKASLETLTAYFAHELAGKGIRVNGVNPGFLETDSTRKMLGPLFKFVSRGAASRTPLKRNADLSEVAEVIRFLLSAESGWILGQTIKVDGGEDFSMALPEIPKLLKVGPLKNAP